MDPCQRLVLERGYEALHDAALYRAALGGSLTGVFLGFSGTEFAQVLAASPAGGSVYAATGSTSSVASGRAARACTRAAPPRSTWTSPSPRTRCPLRAMRGALEQTPCPRSQERIPSGCRRAPCGAEARHAVLHNQTRAPAVGMDPSPPPPRARRRTPSCPPAPHRAQSPCVARGLQSVRAASFARAHPTVLKVPA